LSYEKQRLTDALELMRKRVEEKVPIISEVEKRRIELEQESTEMKI